SGLRDHQSCRNGVRVGLACQMLSDRPYFVLWPSAAKNRSSRVTLRLSRPYEKLVRRDSVWSGRGGNSFHDLGRQAEAHVLRHDLNLMQIVVNLGAKEVYDACP